MIGNERKMEINVMCLYFTKKCADNFVKKFDFLTKFDFTLALRYHASHSKCNTGLREFFVHIENPNFNYKADVFFPMAQIEKDECDFCSPSLDPTNSSGEYEKYTYASGAMTMATLFG